MVSGRPDHHPDVARITKQDEMIAVIALLVQEVIPWTVSAAEWVRLKSITLQQTSPHGMCMNPTGTKLYVIGLAVDNIDEYNLVIPWDISTLTAVRSLDISAKEPSPRGIFLSPDGTKMYVVGVTNDKVHEYTLSTPWDISSETWIRDASAVNTTDPMGVWFKADGTKMYLASNIGLKINEYDLGTAWDISTLSYVNNFPVGDILNTAALAGVFFKPDGFHMYVSDAIDDIIGDFELSVAWDVTTGVLVDGIKVASEETQLTGVWFKADGTKMYIIGLQVDEINEYDI